MEVFPEFEFVIPEFDGVEICKIIGDDNTVTYYSR